MPLTDDELIRDVFNGTDSTARDLAARLEHANEQLEVLRAALKRVEQATYERDVVAGVRSVLESLNDLY
jgi:hypothetical protein